MQREKDFDIALAGTDASGLDHETRRELEQDMKTCALGRLGTSGYFRVMPEQYNIRNRRQYVEEGEN